MAGLQTLSCLSYKVDFHPICFAAFNKNSLQGRFIQLK